MCPSHCSSTYVLLSTGSHCHVNAQQCQNVLCVIFYIGLYTLSHGPQEEYVKLPAPLYITADQHNTLALCGLIPQKMSGYALSRMFQVFSRNTRGDALCKAPPDKMWFA